MSRPEDIVKKFWEERANAYSDWAYRYYTNPGSTRYPQAEVRRDRLLELMADLTPGRMLDAGCGIGQFMVTAQELGWDCYGFDISENMVAKAKEHLAANGLSADSVSVSAISDLSAYDKESFDLIVCLGVLGYVDEESERKAFAEFRRVLKDDGMALVTNVNGLLDLIAFNRLTLDFHKRHFLSRFLPEAEAEAVRQKLEGLITHPQKPDKTGRWATVRDTTYSKQEIPLIYGQKVKKLGFVETRQVFYHLHTAAPLLFESEPSLEPRTIPFEKEYSEHWIANFFASGFISVLKKDSRAV